MTLIDFGEFKLRFDPKEVRISIDGDLIDIGARIEEKRVLPEINEGPTRLGLWKIEEATGATSSYVDRKGIKYEIYTLSGLIDHPEWEVDAGFVSPDTKERSYIHKKTKQRLTRSELIKRILNSG